MTMLIRYGHNTPPLIPPMLLKIRLNFVQFAVIQNFLPVFLVGNFKRLYLGLQAGILLGIRIAI